MADVLLIKCWNPGHTESAKVPPLGVMSLAAVLRQAGHTVRILHVGVRAKDTILDAIKARRPDVIGLSAVVFEYTVFKNLAQFLNKSCPDIPLMAGGPLAWSNPLTTLRTAGIRVIGIGECDRTVVELVDALTSGKDLSLVPGAGVLREDKLVRGPVRPMLTATELDELPPPAWDLLDLKDHFRYHGMAAVGIRPYMQIQTSRGCPYGCVYCHGLMGRMFRARSTASVLEEVRILRERFDIHEFEIVDDCFNLDRARMHEILRGLIDFHDPALRLQFPNGIRADLLEEGDILLLRRAGTDFMSFAFETASPRLQKLIRKHLDIEKALAALNIAEKAGIFCNGFFMLGFPTETAEECRSTIDLACSTKLHEALFFEVSPFKGTELFDIAIRESDVDVAKIAIDDIDYFHADHNLSKMSDRAFGKLFTSAYTRFYLNPSRIFRLLARHPRPLQMVRQGPALVIGTIRLMWRNAHLKCAAKRDLSPQIH